jgi:hypothetical protein
MSVPVEIIAEFLASTHTQVEAHAPLEKTGSLWGQLPNEEKDRWLRVARATRAARIDVEDVARICHEVNASYFRALGGNSQASWEDAPEEQKIEARERVRFHACGCSSPEEHHGIVLAHKRAKGWVYGPVKDLAKKEDPCMASYDQLPKEQQIGYHIFAAVVQALNTMK